MGISSFQKNRENDLDSLIYGEWALAGHSVRNLDLGFLQSEDLSYYKTPKLSKIEVRTSANKQELAAILRGLQAFISQTQNRVHVDMEL